MLTSEQIDRECEELAERARQACVTLAKITVATPDGDRCVRIRGWLESAKSCLRNAPALADRIIALRTTQAAQEG